MAKRKHARVSTSPTPASERRLEKTSDGRLEKTTERRLEKTTERRLEKNAERRVDKTAERRHGKKNPRPVGPASSAENVDPANPTDPETAPTGDGAPGSSVPTKPEEYTVEKVLNKRFVNGSIEYLLKWKGYSIGESTWEPLDFINALELIEEYEERVKHKTDLPNYVITNERDVIMVVGISRVIGRLEFVVKYRDGTALLVPARFANIRYPLRVIEFYERNLKMIPNIKVLREAAKRRAAKQKKN